MVKQKEYSRFEKELLDEMRAISQSLKDLVAVLLAGSQKKSGG